MTRNPPTDHRVTHLDYRTALQPSDIPLDDPRYADLTLRGANKRFTPRPSLFRMPRTTEQVVTAVQDAVDGGHRLTVRSGGHCFENFTGEGDIHVVIDLVEMTGIYFDPRHQAFAVEPGARLADVYRTLFHNWGVTLPGGNSATVAMGGHVAGGGYGSLSRTHGAIVDHLWAVEVVVVDASGRTRSVVATRDPEDLNRELWWAHTGGGGGSFGVATRYWFRSPDADDVVGNGVAPRRTEAFLPLPPSAVLTGTVLFPRAGLTVGATRTLLRNYGEWHEEHGSPDSEGLDIFSNLVLFGRGQGDGGTPGALVTVHVADRPGAEEALHEHTAALSAGLGNLPVALPTETLPWLASQRALAAAHDADVGRQKAKSAYHRRALTDQQAEALAIRMADGSAPHDSCIVSLESHGGRVNAVAPGATAMPQRDSVMRVFFMNTWQKPAYDDACTEWMRHCYHDVYAATGGVPLPDTGTDGCGINFSDIDLADPRWNTSGEPWHRLYFKDGYPRLQRVKAEWDPGDVFRHALSVRLPG